MIQLGSPLDGGIKALRVNRTLHGRSVHRPDDVPGHNVVKAYSTPGRGDGVDLFCVSGTAVKAMHGGRVTRISEPDGRLGCTYIAGVIDGHEVITIYAHVHLRDTVKVGAKITAGQCIGYVNRKLKDPHLHLEVWIDGKAISEPTAEKLRDSIARRIA